MNRLARLMALTVALLCLFTVGAGAAVAHLLPARLKLFELPEVAAARSHVASDRVSEVAGGHRAKGGGPPTASGVSARLSGLLNSGELGQRVGALVVNYSTGQTLYSVDAGTGFTPASTTKVATAVAAIDTFGPSARFTTAVRLSPAARPAIVLVGGGDPTLSAGRYPADSYPRPASLAALASQTTRTLQAKGITSVRLTYDNTLFVGPTPGGRLARCRVGRQLHLHRQCVADHRARSGPGQAYLGGHPAGRRRSFEFPAPVDGARP